MEDIYNYNKRRTLEVKVGDVVIGGDYPIVIQSMANVKTSNTEEAVKQAIRIFESGAKIVRFTTPSMADARNMKNIEEGILASGFSIPLVADVHFSPDIADEVSTIVEKVRINPGNYVRSIRTDKTKPYSKEEYKKEYELLRERFIKFLQICKTNNTAIRIGVNHGSLSERIMDRYGDTPEGIVESCMEMLRICKDEKFENVVVSVKSSNTSMMVRTVRLLASIMNSEDLFFPIHLGVTEAGEGEDGRIKSAIGIGTLLSEGIGDTIRVSLSEEPEVEPVVARQIINYVCRKMNHDQIFGPYNPYYNKYGNDKRKTIAAKNIGGNNVPIVISDISGCDPEHIEYDKLDADILYVGMNTPDNVDKIFLVDALNVASGKNIYRKYSTNQLDLIAKDNAKVKFLELSLNEINTDNNFKFVSQCEKAVRIIELLKSDSSIVVIADSDNINKAAYQRALILSLEKEEIYNPVITHIKYTDDGVDVFVEDSVDFGPNLIDKLSDGIWITTTDTKDVEELSRISFSILQATGSRITKTEYISCPGCGRTMFDLQTTISRVKNATSHLIGLKIGIMGCIVNGPGEMADADYGYVGAGKDRISLYKGRECIEKNIPEEDAVEKLIEIMKANGDWR